MAPRFGLASGSLEVRLAQTPPMCAAHSDASLWRVLQGNVRAAPTRRQSSRAATVDAFDWICDHLLVLDHAVPRGPARKPTVVGTYRLLRQDIAERNSGFYSANEFDLASLVARHRGMRFLELGRSCVLAPYRNKRTVELLWHGIWSYVLRHKLDAMVGCASLEGTDPNKLALQLSFLHHHARAPEAWRTDAHCPERYVEMNRMQKAAIEPKAALHALPPLIKGYLRLGATFGDGAVVDRQFGTTDVFSDVAGLGHQRALCRALRRNRRPSRRLGVTGVTGVTGVAARRPRRDDSRSSSGSGQRAAASARYFRAG